MKAVIYKTFGPPDVLKLVNHPLPQRSAGEVLVKIRSTSVNPVDYKIRRGSIPVISKKEKVLLGRAHQKSRCCHRHKIVLSCDCLHAQILGGDLAGVVESADADSQVYAQRLLLQIFQAIGIHSLCAVDD